MSYKVILWDIDGTLLDFSKAEEISIRYLFDKYHLGECTDEMLNKYVAINKVYWEKFEKGLLKKQEVMINRFIDFFKVYNLPLDIVESFNVDYQHALGDVAIYEKYAEEVVRTLKGKYKQYGVTNGTKIAQLNKLHKSGLDQILDKVFISEEMAINKPKKEYFDIVFNDIGVTSLEEVLIVGDSLTSDIQGGKNANITTVWYNSRKEINTKGPIPDYEIDDLRKLFSIIGA